MAPDTHTLNGLIETVGSDKRTLDGVLTSFYDAIDAHEDELGAFISLADPDALLSHARAKSDLPLRGAPIAVKDLIATTELSTTCGSRFLADYHSIYDATVVTRLKEAGATILGKTNLDEFGMGSANEHSAFGPTRNPVDPTRVPGGSSGGSAAAVAAGLAPAALGTDTGGSTRLPASFCGVVGLKPTYGRVSRYGLIAYASSLDQIGPITRNVADAALMLETIAGPDARDSTALEDPPPRYTDALVDDLADLRVGVVRDFLAQLDEPAREQAEGWIATLQHLGARIVDVELPHADYALPAYYLISAAEASANLARFDGVRYTRRASGASVESLVAESRDAGFGPEVKQRIMLGTFALSAGYHDAWYGKAQRVRTLIRRDFAEAFSEADVLLAPTAPTPPFSLAERRDDPVRMYQTDAFLVPVNLAGLCAISVPGGPVEGLPFGMQLIGPQLGEERILQAAFAFEQSRAQAS